MKGVALVTGAGSGIGRHSATALAAAGFHVVLTGRRLDALNETAAACAEGAATAISCDVADSDAVDGLFNEIKKQHGRLDVLFNNAGTNCPPNDIHEISVDEWKQVIDVNLHGAFLCARGAFGLMAVQDPKGGRIINNGSISAYVPRPGSIPYTVSKHAITGLTRTLSLDGRKHGIACGQIDIGNAASEMTARMNAGVPQADGSIKPEPTMDVKNVANAVVHMSELPLDTNVQFMTIMASDMPFVGRG